jgi:hypothetical protein
MDRAPCQAIEMLLLVMHLRLAPIRPFLMAQLVCLAERFSGVIVESRAPTIARYDQTHIRQDGT